jgi:hypothetical protein
MAFSAVLDISTAAAEHPGFNTTLSPRRAPVKLR